MTNKNLMKKHKDSCHHKDDNDTLPSDVRCRCICTCPEVSPSPESEKFDCMKCNDMAGSKVLCICSMSKPTPKSGGWEERFYEKFPPDYEPLPLGYIDYLKENGHTRMMFDLENQMRGNRALSRNELIKIFFRSEISSAEERAIERCIEIVKKSPYIRDMHVARYRDEILSALKKK